MTDRVAAVLVALAAALCFWLVWILDLTGRDLFSTAELFRGFFLFLDATPALLMAWAAALLGDLLLRGRAPGLAAMLGIIAPVCGLAAACIELWGLHRGAMTLDVPEDEIVLMYIPRLAAASGLLGLTLLGLSVQLVFGRSTKAASAHGIDARAD